MFLPRIEIINRIFNEQDFNKRIIVTPFFDPDEQIGDGTLDLRLGFSFLKMSREYIPYVNVLDEDVYTKIDSSHKKILYYPRWTTKEITLHPGDFLLGATLEYVKLPDDLMALISGRSSWARLGIVIQATGGVIHPNFNGTITFELANVSSMPVNLYPGMRIAQLVFSSCSND
ncbi:MAG: dCTP deaminase [Promethearchaeota archaeon]